MTPRERRGKWLILAAVVLLLVDHSYVVFLTYRGARHSLLTWVSPCICIVLLVAYWWWRSPGLGRFVGWLTLFSGIGGLYANGTRAVRLITAPPEDLAGLVTKPIVVVTVLGLLCVAAGLTVLFSPAVRAYLRFRRTGLSNTPSKAPVAKAPDGMQFGGGVFLSYRRADCSEVVRRMYDRLVKELGRDKVFLDVDNISLASEFPKVLAERMAETNVALVVIGPGWLQATDATGRGRLDDPGDFVRLEIEQALNTGVPVVPVLVSGAAIPAEHDLPESLSRLVKRNGIQVRPDPNFELDMDALVEKLPEAAQTRYWGGGPDARVVFNMQTERKYDPCEAHEVNERLLDWLGSRSMRIVGWGLDPYRVRCQARWDTFESVKTAYFDGRLERLTGAKWVDFAMADDDQADMVRPFQTPLSISEEYKEDSAASGLVCYRNFIEGCDQVASEAKSFVGEPTQNLEDMRVYITRVWLGFKQYTYVHSNFVTPGYTFPTKIITTARVSLLTLFKCLVFAEEVTGGEFDRAMALHRDRVQYIVNEVQVRRGDPAFYCGATKVRFVSIGKRWWPF